MVLGWWLDSFYLQLAAEGGLVLLGAFLWVLVRAGKGLVAAYVDQADPYLRGVVAGVFGGFVAVAFANVTASVWETVAVGSGFWFLVGLASAPLEAEFRLPRAGRLTIEARDGQPVDEAPSAQFSPSGRVVTVERG
jgi:O-antigen ligase